MDRPIFSTLPQKTVTFPPVFLDELFDPKMANQLRGGTVLFPSPFLLAAAARVANSY